MRLSDLLDTEVVDRDGRSLGGVADVVLVQDGPLWSDHRASLRVAGLVVVEHKHFRLLGYEREVRPVVFRWLVRRLAGKTMRVDWDNVAEVQSHVVTLSVRGDDLDEHRREHRAPEER